VSDLYALETADVAWMVLGTVVVLIVIADLYAGRIARWVRSLWDR